MSISTTVFSEPLFNFKLSHCHRLATIHRFKPNSSHSLSSTSNIINYGSCSWTLKPPHKFLSPKFETFATNTDTLQEIQSSDDVIFNQTHPINRIELVYNISPFWIGTLFLVCREYSGNTQMKNL